MLDHVQNYVNTRLFIDVLFDIAKIKTICMSSNITLSKMNVLCIDSERSLNILLTKGRFRKICKHTIICVKKERKNVHFIVLYMHEIV